MPWVVLVLAGALEAVWALALDRSQGFTRPVPVAIFVVALALSMGGLGWALRDLPVGTAYAVWVGIGAALTVAGAVIVGDEVLSPARLACVVAIVGGVVGLKVLH